jgi:hypothetical protein
MKNCFVLTLLLALLVAPLACSNRTLSQPVNPNFNSSQDPNPTATP